MKIKRILDQKGAIGVLVALAMGTVALAVAFSSYQRSLFQFRAHKNMARIATHDVLRTELAAIINNFRACSAVFGGESFDNATYPIGTPMNITKLAITDILGGTKRDLFDVGVTNEHGYTPTGMWIVKDALEEQQTVMGVDYDVFRGRFQINGTKPVELGSTNFAESVTVYFMISRGGATVGEIGFCYGDSSAPQSCKDYLKADWEMDKGTGAPDCIMQRLAVADDPADLVHLPQSGGLVMGGIVSAKSISVSYWDTQWDEGPGTSAPLEQHGNRIPFSVERGDPPVDRYPCLFGTKYPNCKMADYEMHVHSCQNVAATYNLDPFGVGNTIVHVNISCPTDRPMFAGYDANANPAPGVSFVSVTREEVTEIGADFYLIKDTNWGVGSMPVYTGRCCKVKMRNRLLLNASDVPPDPVTPPLYDEFP